MSRHAQVELPDGRQLDYEIRPSTKAKTLRLKVTAREGLTVIAPKTLSDGKVDELVAGKRDWIIERLDQFEEVRHLLGERQTSRPEAFVLPAVAETWRVEYRINKGRNVGASTDRQGRVLVFGAVQDNE